MRAFAFGLVAVVTLALAVAADPEPKVEAPAKLPPSLTAAGPGADLTEAFASFELLTNGSTDQAAFDAAFGQFSEDAHAVAGPDAEGGLGPTFNGTSCLACHPNANGSPQRELRAGHFDGTVFSAPVGGTLVRLQATDARAQQRPVPGFDDVLTERITTTLRGLAFVEMVRDNDLVAIRAGQPADVRGTLVPVVVTTGANPDGTFATAYRYGRFGHKCQHGSLLDFAADADRNEKGRTSPLQPLKAPALDGRTLDQFVRSTGLDDPPTDDHPFGEDIESYTRLMRALPAPPRDFALQNTPDVLAGATLFTRVGCAVCHVPTMNTAPAGSSINGFASVPAALGDKVFHPFGDFMLHNVGTGDGIIQGGSPETRNMVRTAPLWGLRIRTVMMHDGRSATLDDAIGRHGGQAAGSRGLFLTLPADDKRKVKTFLLSL